MSDLARRDRATLLSQMAPSDTVTPAVLLDDGTTGRLAGEPPISYLDRSEAPAYAMTNRKRGVGIGTKSNRTDPDDDHATVFLVTGRRTLALIGRASGDRTLDVPHSAVGTVVAHTGFLAHRLELRTSTGAYHCWFQRSTGGDVVESAAAFVDEHGDDAAEATVSLPDGNERPPETGTSTTDATVTYRGQQVDPSYLE